MRTGIFGGTFSPIHNGHIKAAKAFLSELSLDVLYVIPDRIPPHKQISGNDDPWLRLEMVKKAFEDEEKIVVTDVELRREGKSYTVETLPEFTGNGELFMLIGTDMFLSFDRWYRFRDIFAMCSLVLMVRESRESSLRAEIDAKKAIYESMGAKIYELTAEPFPISSTELRAKIAAGEDTGEYLPECVRRFIDEKGLYR
ncbi:MAG: nicotinate (nicotinamide) nucleotide adenylyltransferase [Clostridia bacterium]|nr:nicotinate (nicotinamide) nucleotide adenylyltransferase [Clostridia bacterium]